MLLKNFRSQTKFNRRFCTASNNGYVDIMADIIFEFRNLVINFSLFPINNAQCDMKNIAHISRNLSDIMTNVDNLSLGYFILFDEVRQYSLYRATKEEIRKIWENYHKEKYCVAAVIEPQQYRKLRERWEKYPVFCIPCIE